MEGGTTLIEGTEEATQPGSITRSEPSARRLPWIVHPWLFAIYPIVSLYAKNIHEAGARELRAPLELAVLAVLAIWLAASLATRDRVRGGFVASLAVLAFYVAPHFETDIDHWLWSLSWLLWSGYPYKAGPYGSAACGVLILAAAGYFLLFRLKNVSRLTNFLNVFSAVLLAFPILAIAEGKKGYQGSHFKEAPAITLPRPATASPEKQPPPDIYYVVLDGLARGDVLAERFDLDIEPFLQRLEKKGFYIARRSTSNYAQTPLSLSSSLNGVYLDSVVKPEAIDLAGLGELIRRSAVEKALRGQGYRSVFYASGFDQTENPRADEYRSPYPYYSGFHLMLMTTTPAGRFFFTPITDDSYTMTRRRSLHIFETLPEVADDPAPTFTFAHMLAPHPPFVFGRDGEDVSPHDIRYYLSDGNIYHNYYGDHGNTNTSYVSLYRNEAIYLLKRLEVTIDALLKRSKTPPVIVIQGDHGSGSRLDTGVLENTDLHERMSIFNAYYLPPQADHQGLYPTISPVNSFRMIFNACFNAGLPLLPDRNYFSNWNYPCEFVDVTEIVAQPKKEPIPTTNPSLGSH